MINVVPLPPVPELARLWTSLASQSSHSFFLSWHWIGTWLHCLGPSINPMLLTVSSGTTPAASAILVKNTIWRRGVIPVRTWNLNATGQDDFDCIGIEYNGLLAIQGQELPAWNEVAGYFAGNRADWDEVSLDGIASELATAWINEGLTLRETRRDPSRYIDLDAVRASAELSCLPLLPARTRTRIRHTIKSLQAKHGALSVSVAGSREEALEGLTELIRLHDLKWVAHPSKGAFNQPFAERFHRELITRHFQEGVIQIARVCAGPVCLGILYNFVYQGRVYFYQSGINYQVTEKHESPGLLIHSLLIDCNAALGHDVYDMLAGDSQYKRALTNRSTELWWGALQTSRAKLRAERVLTQHYRALRRRIRRLGA